MKSKPDSKMTAINDKTILSSDILIVDDEIPNLKLLAELLGHAGYQVRSTEKPQLAIDSALAKPPALILLDVKMPEMDGFEVCKRLKQDERTCDIPVIFISALQDVQDRIRGFEVGGVDFISKPIQKEEVLARVRTHTELRNMQLNLERMVAKRTAEVIESEQRFRVTFEQAAVGIAHVSPEGRFLRINKKFCDIVGYSNDEMLALTFQDITHPEDLDADLEYVQQVLNAEIETYTMDKKYYRKDGSIVWVNLTVSLVFDEGSNPKYFVSVIQDISERKQAEETLRQNRDFLEHLTSAVPDTIFSIKFPERTINWANDSFNVLGYETEEYIGQSTKKFYANPEDYDAVGRLQQDAIRKGDDMIRTEVMALRKDGRVIPAELTATFYREGGKLSQITALVRDISERKLAEEKLVKSEAKYRSLVDNSMVGVFESTADGRFTFANDAMVQMFDFDSPEQMIAHGSVELWNDIEDRERMLAELQKHGRVSNFETEAVTRAGRHIHVLFSAKQLGDRISGMVMDISDRKQAEEEIRKLNEDLERRVETRTAELKKLSEAVKQSPVTVVITDKNGTIEYVNPRFSKVTGYTAKEAIGQNPRILKAGDKPESFYKDLWDTILSGRTWRGEFLNRKKNDEEFWESASISPIKNNEGEITHLVAVKQDITEKKRIEEELLQSKLAAEEANQAKSMFLANMSHELRTPLNAILGFSQMLAREPDGTADQKEKLTIINRSGEHLLAMINDVLDLSKIEAGRVELEAEDFDLKLMLEDIGRMFALRAKNGGLDFELSIDVELVRYVRADSGKLRQILINLLSNAVKFTDQGGVSLRARSIPIPDGPAMVRLQLEVEDSGSGISPELAENIFEPFYQVSKIQAGSKGTGLGLAISKSFVKMMGGEISVDSTPGKGSLFRVELPVALAEATEVVDVGSVGQTVLGLEPGQPAWRILIVEDNLENRLLLSSLLHKAGFEIREAENGEEAIELFKKWQPHLIWMDMRMPVMDGYEAARQIRQCSGGDTVPIIAITASAFSEQHHEILAAGCDDMVIKPFQAHEIFEMMGRFLDIEYIHESEQEAAPVRVPEVELTAAMLADLPEELLQRLRETTLELNMEVILEVIDRIESHAPETAKHLRALVQAFQIQRIREVLKKVEDK